MDPNLYERCPICDGAARLNGARCVCARGETPGFVKVGISLAQVIAYADRERALAGDPGVPEAKRLAVLLKLRSRVGRALDRLTADVGGESG